MYRASISLVPASTSSRRWPSLGDIDIPWTNSALQAEPSWSENVVKLASSGYSELHLAIRLHDSQVPFGLFAGLWNPEEIRSADPSGIGPLTDLWLVIGYGNAVTRWSSGQG